MFLAATVLEKELRAIQMGEGVCSLNHGRADALLIRDRDLRRPWKAYSNLHSVTQ